MKSLSLKPTQKVVKDYYEALAGLGKLYLFNEGAVSPAFASLLRTCARQYNWTLAEQYSLRRGESTIRADGALLDSFKLVQGIWEAKDTKDDLDVEVKRKFDAGYPKDNTLFQAPDRLIIWQDGRLAFDDSILKPSFLVEGLKVFFQYQPPAYDQWQQAVEEFKLRVRELGDALVKLIETERRANLPFIKAFKEFGALLQQTINPNLSTAAIEDMLIQHILTERLFRKVFDNPDFVERNAIAKEIEKVVQALTSRKFSRQEFLQPLDRFYGAIETTASTLKDFTEKQHFLDAVYQRFFQGFSVKVADTHGIVYTPPPIAHFMIRLVEDILQNEFGRSLADKDVPLLDPFVGTGTFVVLAMHKMPKSRLPDKYATELHCNEVMLLPYYIASINIEHAYYELVGEYKPFNVICLVDTFELAEPKGQQSLYMQQNTERVDLQKRATIFVIIGNPPYNAGQVNENDNNKNRKYPTMDKRVSETYAKDSTATLLRKLSDPYVKAIRWATDRIGDEGIVAFVTNNSFIDSISFDGMRKHLAGDFSKIYHLNLKGNARTSGERRRREAGNVFDDAIRVSVGITFFVKKKEPGKRAKVFLYSVEDYLKSSQKKQILDSFGSYTNVPFTEIVPDSRSNWLAEELDSEFDSLIPLGAKASKATGKASDPSVFGAYTLGVSTNRDSVVYDFNAAALAQRMERFCDDYNAEVSRYFEKGRPKEVDDFVSYDKVRWSSTLKNHLRGGARASFDRSKVRDALYRPFARKLLYYDRLFEDRPGLFSKVFPTTSAQSENRVVCLTARRMSLS